MRSAWSRAPPCDFSSGVFLSSASPVHDTNTVGMTSVAPFGRLADVRGAGRVPAGVAAGLEGGADAAGGEAELASGSPLTSSLPLNSAIAAPVPVGREEAVVLLGGQAGHRLEQVGVVRGPVLDGPVLHGAGDRVGDGRVERHAPA